MAWHVYVAYFFGGMFLVNAVPHFVSGVMGRRFPSPFASPPGKGESSAVVKWCLGAFNLVVGYLLVLRRVPGQGVSGLRGDPRAWPLARPAQAPRSHSRPP